MNKIIIKYSIKIINDIFYKDSEYYDRLYKLINKFYIYLYYSGILTNRYILYAEIPTHNDNLHRRTIRIYCEPIKYYDKLGIISNNMNYLFIDQEKHKYEYKYTYYVMNKPYKSAKHFNTFKGMVKYIENTKHRKYYYTM